MKKTENGTSRSEKGESVAFPQTSTCATVAARLFIFSFYFSRIERKAVGLIVEALIVNELLWFGSFPVFSYGVLV